MPPRARAFTSSVGKPRSAKEGADVIVILCSRRLTRLENGPSFGTDETKTRELLRSSDDPKVRHIHLNAKFPRA